MDKKEEDKDQKIKKDPEPHDNKDKKVIKKRKNEEDHHSGSEESSESRGTKEGPQPEEGPKEKLCFLHEMKLVYFCETCEEPICDKCILLGPHNNQVSIIIHNVTSLLIIWTFISCIE